MIGRYKKGRAPADIGEESHESFHEAPIDRFPEGSDGDNAELLDQYEHLVTDEQIEALEEEVPE
jgi:hypothetical protein